jgi:hypothetical protein
MMGAVSDCGRAGISELSICSAISRAHLGEGDRRDRVDKVAGGLSREELAVDRPEAKNGAAARHNVACGLAL